jgi:uncharacterized protein YdhG (YjbR/CyaY superfamily)
VRIVLRVSAVDDYFGGLDASARAAFEHIQNLVMDMVPDAEAGTSYGIAALKYKQKPLLGFLAAKQHLSIFPFSSQVVDAARDRLTGFELSKGAIRFTIATPLPDEVVRDIVRYRVEEILRNAPGDAAGRRTHRGA